MGATKVNGSDLVMIVIERPDLGYGVDNGQKACFVFRVNLVCISHK
jgi:hypothetical protein